MRHMERNQNRDYYTDGTVLIWDWWNQIRTVMMILMELDQHLDYDTEGNGLGS